MQQLSQVDAKCSARIRCRENCGPGSDYTDGRSVIDNKPGSAQPSSNRLC